MFAIILFAIILFSLFFYYFRFFIMKIKTWNLISRECFFLSFVFKMPANNLEFPILRNEYNERTKGAIEIIRKKSQNQFLLSFHENIFQL